MSSRTLRSSSCAMLAALSFGCGSGAGDAGPGLAGAGSGGGAGAAGLGAGGGEIAGAAAISGGNAGGATAPSGGGGGIAGVAGLGGSAAGGGSAGSASTGGAGGATSGGGAPDLSAPHNPILSGLHADPQIAELDGKFYLYPTNDGFADWMTPKFNAFSSTDLVHWHDEGVVLDLGPDVSWADSQAWAPGITQKGDTYYFYFSAGLQIGVATAKSPSGPFKDALGHPLVTKGQYGGQSIDPFVFADDDGRYYLYFGSGSSAHVGELNADLLSFKTTPIGFKIGAFREGSALFKRNGTYYFMWSENDTRSADYHVAYATGKSPMGPFTLGANNPLLQKDEAQGILGTGHHSVLKLDNGDYYIAYHRFAIPGGDGTHREVCLDRLEFAADGSLLPVKPTR